MRTVGRRAALVAAALTALSPFLIFYSAEARGYELMIALVLVSTLALLRAVEQRADALVGRATRSRRAPPYTRTTRRVRCSPAQLGVAAVGASGRPPRRR